jgi:hypothetical protein
MLGRALRRLSTPGLFPGFLLGVAVAFALFLAGDGGGEYWEVLP